MKFQGDEIMLKVRNPYQREIVESEDIAFRAPCMCSTVKQNYTATKQSGPGCRCSCNGSTNLAYNDDSARN